jgi:ATP adenylyltransferase/5',5'''-P-1,P-4-tetraphosphate phosphorylase II
VRVCPALKAKHDSSAAAAAASADRDEDDKPTPAPKRSKPDDPFEGPYETDLLVGRVGQEEGGEKMVALLNKFSVVPGASAAPCKTTLD